MKPTAVICDIDGTLAHMVNRGPYDTSRYMEDEPDYFIRDIFDSICIRNKAANIIVSGRSEDFRDVTERWLHSYGIVYKHLYMRPSGNKLNDAIVKREIYENLIEPAYNVICVLDDRNRVVNMWRNELGLRCLQVADGDF